MTYAFPRMAAAIGLAGLACVAATPAAAQRCAGTYAATAIHPLPQPIVARLDIRDNSPENMRLGASFMQGVRDAGTRADGAANAVISINYSVIDLNAGLGGVEGPSYEGFGGFSDGPDPSLPGSSRLRLRQPSHPHAPVTLSLRAEVTQPGSTQVAWVLSLQCQMTEQEPVSLAYDVGRMVGGTIGQTVRPRAF
jgi:hypothetical protein